MVTFREFLSLTLNFHFVFTKLVYIQKLVSKQILTVLDKRLGNRLQIKIFFLSRIVEGLMIQQFRPSLNKQVISYVSKLFPLGIT